MSIGAFFAAESMFHRAGNASKVALVGLLNYLAVCCFELVDIQMLTPHTERLGAISIPKAEYLLRLVGAVQEPDRFHSLPITCEFNLRRLPGPIARLFR